MTHSDTRTHSGANPQQAVPAIASGDLSRVELLGALSFGLLAVVVAGVLGWGALFWGGAQADGIRPTFYMLGLAGAAFAGIVTVWLHGRIAGLRGGHDAALSGRLIAARMQGLLAAGFVVKLAVLVLGFFFVRRITIDGSPTKFTDVATFAVTFAAAALLCQLATAARLSRSMRQLQGARPAHNDGHVPTDARVPTDAH